MTDYPKPHLEKPSRNPKLFNWYFPLEQRTILCFHLAFGVRPATPPSGRASLQGSPSPGILGFTPSKRTRDRSTTDSRQPITLFPPLPPYYAAQTTCPPCPPSSDQDRTRSPEPPRRCTVAPPPRRLAGGDFPGGCPVNEISSFFQDLSFGVVVNLQPQDFKKTKESFCDASLSE